MSAGPVRAAAEPPAWIAARPIAHRGLHDGGRGLVENSAEAARAAMSKGYAIECDVQLTRDGDAAVFHDFTLDRLTSETGPVTARSASELQAIPYAAGSGRIIVLSRLLDLIAGRVPLVCEIKSRFNGDVRLADRVAALAREYRGPLVIKSFDPRVIAHLRHRPPCPLGVVAEARYDAPEWSELPPGLGTELAQFLHYEETRPDFLSYHVDDLPHGVPLLLRRGLGLPVVAWTVRRPEQVETARRWADQIVFEGFEP